jgi:hypothetical protein
LLDSRRVHWAHFSQIDVTLRGLEAIEQSGLDPDHTVLITGQHYPIKPRSEIARRLRDPTVSFMKYSPLPNYQWWPADGGLDRFQHVHLWTPRGRIYALPIRRRLPNRYQPFGGSAYWSLGRTHRRYVLDAVRRDGELIRCFRHSRAGDEVFFQTILMSSSAGDSVVNDSLVFAKWKEPATRPTILTSEDFGAIAVSEALFARKFDYTVDERVLDLIDERLLAVA